MSDLSCQTISALLSASCRKLYIAYSGGVDSHVLLHLCASQAALNNKIVAVYVDHGLHAAAAEWGEHCRQQAGKLGVEFRMLQVDAHPHAGESPEAAARDARYKALQSLLQADDVLLLAQHREDQMETLLLQLFRGAGVSGLAGMPTANPFGKGQMLRPLLNVAKRDIQQYAQVHNLQWVEDPSNQSADFDRNYLRNDIIPLLKQRWPSLDKTVARSAGHCGDAALMIDAWAEQALQTVYDPQDGSLAIASLSDMTTVQSSYLLRHWLHRNGFKRPSQAVLKVLREQLIGARDDALPQLFMQGFYIKKYRQKLFCMPAERLHKIQPKVWTHQNGRVLLSNGYSLNKRSASFGIDKQLWDAAVVTVAPRQGGERLQLPGRAGHHCLKKLYQAAAIPPWEREIRPLIYLDDRLAAVAGLWVADWVWCKAEDGCYSLDWHVA